jgi:hypothetical protein
MMDLPDGRLSSSITFVYKFVVPVIWILIVWLLAFSNLGRAYRAMFTHTPSLLAVAVPWAIGFALLLRLVGPLLRVEMRSGRLYASNYNREIEIPPGSIESVSQNLWSSLRPITIHLRNDTQFGRRIRFMPPKHVVWAFWQEDPLVQKLRMLGKFPSDDS